MKKSILLFLGLIVAGYSINADMISDMMGDLMSQLPAKSPVTYYENTPFSDLSLDAPLEKELNGIKLGINIDLNKEYSFVFSDNNSKIFAGIDKKNEGMSTPCVKDDVYYSFKTKKTFPEKKGEKSITWENVILKNDKLSGKTKIVTQHDGLNMLKDTKKTAIPTNYSVHYILSSMFYIPDKDLKINDEWDFSFSTNPGGYLTSVNEFFAMTKVVRNISIEQKYKLLGYANFENKRCAVIEINGIYEYCQLAKDYSISSGTNDSNSLNISNYKALVLLDYLNKSVVSIKFYCKQKGVFENKEYLGNLNETYKLMREKLNESELGDNVYGMYMNSEAQLFLISK